MVTDDERREVAERLRELHLNPWDDAACEIAQCAGIACCNSECHGSNETPECTMALCAHLADLIDPDCEEGRYEGVRTTRPVDREALLALADEMTWCYEGAASAEGDGMVGAWVVMQYADRIREALGVSDD